MRPIGLDLQHGTENMQAVLPANRSCPVSISNKTALDTEPDKVVLVLSGIA